MTSAQNEPRQPPPPLASGDSQPVAHPATSSHTVREDVVAKQKDEFGGMRFFTALLVKAPRSITSWLLRRVEYWLRSRGSSPRSSSH